MEEVAKKEEARGKMRWRKDKEESAWLARVRKNASTLPPTAHCRQNRQAILPYFLPFKPFFLPPLFFFFLQPTRLTTYMSGAFRAGLIFSKHRSTIIFNRNRQILKLYYRLLLGRNGFY